ncbi:N6-adenine-specific DNA methylase [Nitzschia inconspicua]|uniref:N6-adenine-specific DNA methylase n=1 Tax=Nitzschia inconspicua TaxID=303405 RepID=A0A9K3PXC7_9STRA|nr:N6-adenine-specific DNA methylase [Nitzschia inconspicua]
MLKDDRNTRRKRVRDAPATASNATSWSIGFLILLVVFVKTSPVDSFVFPSDRRQQSIAPLFARPSRNQQKIRRQQQEKMQQSIDTDVGGELPANLKRKVNAKRPQLGHVVPAATQAKGSGGSANPRLRPQGKARDAGLNNPSMLKILGGKARGRRLDSPQVYLRPMMGKVREALYSTLQSFELYDYPLRHLDLFAGSGSVGLESLSRGASHCTFCDLSQDCCNAIQRNIQWCQFNENDDENGAVTTKVVCGDVLMLLREPTSVGLPVDEKPYQVITICPPYEEVVYADLMDAVAGSSLVQDDTIVVLEYPVELWGDLPHVYAGKATTMVGIRNRKYGRTVIAMYICNPTGKIENATSRPEEFI